MSNFVINGLLQSRNPLLTFRRFRGKINIQRPRAPHYERARVLEVIKPVYKRPEFNAPCIEAQKANESKNLDNPYETIIAREARNWFDHSNLVAFLHVNSIRQEDMFKAQVVLHRHNISVKVYGKSIMRKALAGTKFETILPLFEAKTAIVFAPEPQKIKQVLSVLKKTPQLVLLAGIVEGRLLSRNEFVSYATMPDLTTTRAQLAAVLDSAGGKIVADLQCHQSQLVNLLDAYAKKDPASSADAGEKVES
ncbi:large ribosomal subunit protein uL10m [Anopheles ziemanni]|uniref:large ribosomal subunit protein uL10m n=1 Tax=Anopheles coustani TaxID=139045 RepID=UPI0026587FD7|nr:large ribosomal subunit protein uL10m [Anopheles coustani]XP_058166284.1 large ribosomal subunit protein uL10m [Anopheles ziemanni]